MNVFSIFVMTTKLIKERIATRCVCCKSENLSSSPAVLMPFVAHRVFGWEPVVIDDTWGLRTIKHGNAYSICNSLFCNDCRFLFLDIRFSEEELSKLYQDYRGQQYTELREYYEPGYADRNESIKAGCDYIHEVENFLRPYLTFPLTILDWGGDTGKNTPFRTNCRSLDIYDISSKAVEEGATLLSKNEVQSKKYSLIVCSNVLEHVSFPSESLSEIILGMGSKSLLYIEVPLENVLIDNESSPHLYKRHWHEHVNFYSELSLRRLVQSAGLTLIDLKRLKTTVNGNPVHLFQVACRLNSL